MKLDTIIASRPTKTVYRDGDYAIKVFNENYSKADVLNEALNQSRVEETALRIPKILEVTKIDNKWAIITEYIEGKTMAQLMAEEPQKLEAYMNQFVDIQMDIHARRVPLLTSLQDKMQRKISESKLDATARYELHTRLASMPKHNKVCHGDFDPSNVVLNDGVPYILDWAHATQGNASADAARSFLLFSLDGQNDMAELYMNIFCQKSDTARQYVQRWMPIVAASQSVKGNLEEQEILLRWANVVEYD